MKYIYNKVIERNRRKRRERERGPRYLKKGNLEKLKRWGTELEL